MNQAVLLVANYNEKALARHLPQYKRCGTSSGYPKMLTDAYAEKI
jgi:hypothetical protein